MASIIHKQTHKVQLKEKDSTNKDTYGEKKNHLLKTGRNTMDLLEDESIFDSRLSREGTGDIVSRSPRTASSASVLSPQEDKKKSGPIKPAIPVCTSQVGTVADAPKRAEGSPSHNWEAAENKLREQLNRIRDNLAEMTERTCIQKSVSKVLTLGIQNINEAVDIAIYELKRMRRLRKQEETRKRNSLEVLAETPLTNTKIGGHIPSPKNVPLVEQKQNETEAWAVVAHRKKQARNDEKAMGPTKRTKTVIRSLVQTKPGNRKGAVLVKPAEGKTYAEIVRSMKKKMEGSGFKDKVHAIRKTKDGAVLVQLEKEEDRSEFQKALQSVIGQAGLVKDLTSKVTLEFLDLDCDTAADEVAAAINHELGVSAQRNVHVFGENSRGQTLAVCEFDWKDATKLLKKSRIKIGWVNCRVRQRLRVNRCHRCLGYGHLKAECKGPDRHDCCWRCGVKGHVGKDCKNSPACFLCTKSDNRHLPGTGACAAFRAALAETKRKMPICL